MGAEDPRTECALLKALLYVPVRLHLDGPDPDRGRCDGLPRHSSLGAAKHCGSSSSGRHFSRFYIQPHEAKGWVLVHLFICHQG